MKMIFLMILLFSAAVFALSNFVTVGFVADIPGSSLISGDNYAGSESDDITVALASSDTENAYTDNGIFVSSNPFRYFLIVSNSGKNVLDEIDVFSADTSYYGNYNLTERGGTARNYVRTDYSGIDIVNRTRWGSGFHKILVKNIGTAKEPKITIQVIE